MGLSYTIDDALRLVTITGEYADAAEWHALLTRVLADPRHRPGLAFLRDLRGGTTPVNAATVVGIMRVVREFWTPLGLTRAAILMPREMDPPALVAHAIADAENIPIQAFTSYDAAIDWLRAGV
jgi:hypothetical protein